MKRIIPLLLAVVMLFTACGDLSSVEVTSAYEKLEAERGREDALAMILYDHESVDVTVTDKISEDEDYVLILPRYVGSKVNLYSIEATGTDSYERDGEKEYTFEVKKDTVIQLCWMSFAHNHMWYLEIESPDGEVYGSPLPYFCETEEDTVYIGKHWDGKENLPYDWGETETVMPLKPVIYLYPEVPTDVIVELDYDGELTCTYPKYQNGWSVTAYPDGTLTDASGMSYYYLYWEGRGNGTSDFSKGFCVPGEDTAVFLEDALRKLGLNRKEANEFIIYWLPHMEQNPYNVIAFQTTAYTETAKLRVVPEPDTLIRVYMAWFRSDNPVPIPEQELTAPERKGFTVVEWGGEVKVE